MLAKRNWKQRVNERRRRSARTLKLGILATLAICLVAACGTGSPSATGKSPTGPAVKGGVVTFAETANYAPTWILPFYSGQYFTIQEQGWFENLMWPPLFNQGNGKSPSDNFATSLGNKPAYSDHNRVVTLTIKHWLWSDGKPVTTRDLMFWIDILKANESQWSDYTPGGFPNNVTSMTVEGKYKLVMKLNKAYSPSYFTLNELSQITPIPQHTWDKVSANGAVGNYDQTTAGSKKVLSFLESQSKDLKTYATNPLWKVVDGPFKLSGYTLTGKVTFTPNARYSGPAKPKISAFVELPYTSNEAEYNALRAGQLTVGYILQTMRTRFPRSETLATTSDRGKSTASIHCSSTSTTRLSGRSSNNSISVKPSSTSLISRSTSSRSLQTTPNPITAR